MTSIRSKTSLDIETPSGKDASYENFPVGSILLPKTSRPHVAIFYRFARTIDDIADNPKLHPEDKVTRLEGFAAAVRGENSGDVAFETGHKMRRSLLETGVSKAHCLDLIDAFKQDAVKSRYETWEDLMDYCDKSAAPVGRYLIDITGGAVDQYRASDALCRALQVLNHLQDCREDYLVMNRVYLPQRWVPQHSCLTELLGRKRSTNELKAVIDRCLDGVDKLLREAEAIVPCVHSRRLAFEASVIHHIAQRLTSKLRKYDPLEKRIVLSKAEYVRCVILGIITGFRLRT